MGAHAVNLRRQGASIHRCPERDKSVPKRPQTRCSGRQGASARLRTCRRRRPVATALTPGDDVLPANPLQDGIIGMASGSRPSLWAPCRRDHYCRYVRTARLRKIAA
jgi:hypothetical protein